MWSFKVKIERLLLKHLFQPSWKFWGGCRNLSGLLRDQIRGERLFGSWIRVPWQDDQLVCLASAEGAALEQRCTAPQQAGGEKEHLLRGMCSLNSWAKQRDREIPWFYRTEACKTSGTHPRLWEEFSKVRKRV